MHLAERLAPGEHAYLGPDARATIAGAVVPIGWVYRFQGSRLEVLRPALLKWKAGDRWIRFYLGVPLVGHAPVIERPTPELFGDALL